MDEDFPRPFGYKMSWLAVRATAREVVVAALRVTGGREVSWAAALDSVYEGPDTPVRGKCLLATVLE